MQQLVRWYFDQVLDRDAQGKQVEFPYVYTFSKGETSALLRNPRLVYADANCIGTPIPSNLILINDYLSRFSLQPSHGMTLPG